MSDRISGFLVTLESSLRDDDAEATLAAIRQIRGVLSVAPVVEDIVELNARARARGELVARIGQVLNEHYV